MVRIGTVWDSALEAVRGRAGMITPIALLTIFLPAVVQAALGAYWVAGDAGRATSASFVSILLAAISVWGGLAIMAIVSHPATSTGDATRQATARLLPALAIAVVIGVAAMLLVVPILGVLATAGVDFAAMRQAGTATAPNLSGGASLFILLYGAFAALLMLWIGARLLPVNPVILHERIGLRAVSRSFQLTRGMGARLVGALLLFVVVLFVAGTAAQLVSGLVFRLALGADGIATATFLAAVVGAIVSTIFTVLAYGFIARLYAMLSGRDHADAPGDAHPAI